MSLTRTVVPVLCGVVLLGGCASAGRSPGPTMAQLSPQSNSGESGTATLTPEGDKTKVVLSVSGAPSGSSQPVHIHKGTCAQLDPKPAFPLSPLVNGKSETVVSASLDELDKGGYAINGHKSAQEASTYVFCGSLGKK
jgi:Cu/Zn superoxide dismutase